MAATPPGPIDIHAHLFVPRRETIAAGLDGYERAAALTADWVGPDTVAHTRTTADTLRRELTDVDVRLDLMDRMGIAAQAVSLAPAQYHAWAGPDGAARLVEVANQALLELAAEHPGRFLPLADVALGHPELAAQQLLEAVAAGMVGVQISSRAGSRELSDPALEPFWAAVEQCAVPVVLHPLGCTLGDRLASRFLNNTVGQPVEHAVALSHLIFSGVLDRHPSLRVVAQHGGGYLPYYLGRSDHAWAVRPESRGCTRPPSSYLERMYFDNLVFDGRILRVLLDLVGSDHVAIGTDYPYDMGVRDPLERLDDVPDLTGHERRNLLRDTAESLFGPVGAAGGGRSG